MKLIKVNLPRTQEAFLSGNGEGCWVKVKRKVKRKHDADFEGGVFEGILDNDSYYYPDLKSGMKLRFTMRGQNKPVALIENCLEHYRVLNDEEFAQLLEEINNYHSSN